MENEASKIDQLNELAEEQQELGNHIIKLLQACKRDGSVKKNEKYIATRQEKLEDLWEKVCENDERMGHIKIDEHSYFATNYFDQIRSKYEETKQYLLECSKAPSASFQNTHEKLRNVQEELVQVKRIKEQKLRIINLLSYVDQAYHALSIENPTDRYMFLLQTIEKQFDVIFQLHMDILTNAEDTSDPYFQNGQFDKTVADCDEVKQKLASKVRKVSVSPSDNDGNVRRSHVALPKVTIPLFYGSYEAWPSFRDMFSNIIHENSALSKTEKMQYLKSHVRGEAYKIIQHLLITESNYVTAWELLSRRFENKRLLVSKWIDTVLELPMSSSPSMGHLKQLHDTTNECLEAISNLGIPVNEWGPILSRILIRKMDPETTQLYEQSLTDYNEVQSFEELLKFLEKRFKCLETAPSTSKQSSTRYRDLNQNEKPYDNKIIKQARNKPQSSCSFCGSPNHTIYICLEFKLLTVQERLKAIKEKQLCYNCLNHPVSARCFSHLRCNICSKKHHSLLHCNDLASQKHGTLPTNYQHKKSKPMNSTTITPTQVNTSTQGTNSSLLECTDKTVLLATALVKVNTPFGDAQVLRVLLDQGSMSSFITEEACQLLGVPRQKIRAEITGFGEERAKTANWKVTVSISPRFSSNFKMDTDLIVFSKLTSDLPRRSIEQTHISESSNMMLADPLYYKSGPVDILLGAEQYSKILLDGIKRTNSGLTAQNTELGWILSGLIQRPREVIEVLTIVTRTEEDNQLRKFWEIEDAPETRNATEEEEACERFYNETTIRNYDGTYTVRIPFKETAELGNSKNMAAARLINIEKNFSRNMELKRDYEMFLQEYLELGHMKEVKNYDKNRGKYFLPHHAVIRESSTTTKLRVVFDASAKTSNKKSLNDIMHVGPRLQQDLADILLRWRTHKYVFCADIEKMYRQIKIHKEDQCYQRILWRVHPSEPMKHYELTTVTYGTASAPYLAIKTLQKLAQDEYISYPEASKVAQTDFYVDDVLTGANTLEEAQHLQKQLIMLLKAGGFNLRKWSSNSKKLLENLPEELIDEDKLKIPNNKEDKKKSLGVQWSPSKDSFYIKITIASDARPTKRKILSEISKIFDPNGWIAPITIQAKLMMQELWVKGQGWDNPVDEGTKKKWENFYQQVNSVGEFEIPRWVHYQSQDLQLHGFSDASELAYGCVVYSRVWSKDTYITTLLQSKSKVAPINKKLTLPRLELCAAHLLAKLMCKVARALGVSVKNQYAWTDSMITLGWIRGDPARWKTFVANRVSEIQQLVPRQHWQHVSSQDNAADVISRGLEANKLKIYRLWWKGPEWLQEDEKTWPAKDLTTMKSTTEEVKICVQVTTTIMEDLTTRFSSLKKMLRVLTYCRKFISRERPITKLSVEDINKTLNAVIRQTQQAYFTEDYKNLLKKYSLPKQSKLLTLNPFIDENAILRVGGRLQKSSLSPLQKQPILLPREAPLAKLIVAEAHESTLHGGIALTLAFIRQKYWIVNLKNLIRYHIKHCVTCIRYNAKTAEQIMGHLPRVRVTPAYPFQHSGVDFAGPIQLRTSKGRGQRSYKGYIAVFVCLVTKAIHLEVVSDMTADTFLAAFRRFTARRGHCAHLFSDNGTNFVGTARILNKEVQKIINTEPVQNKLANVGTQWHFIPPAAPHFGGIWEAGVKSMKFHLKRVIGDSTLTYEEMTTLLHQIEACLNSRPLCTTNEDINDNTILTPSHFLIGRESVGIPDPISTNINSNLSQRWRLIQKMKRDFWKQWTSEYLSRLQNRYRWKIQKENLKANQVVLIKEDNVKPSQWPLARIQQVHTGSDGNVRVVTLKKGDGTEAKRAITSVIPIPDDDELEQERNIPEQTSSLTTETNYTEPVRNKGVSRLRSMLYTLLCCIVMIHGTTANYTLYQPTHGVYIEHLGYTYSERGSFRIQISNEKVKLTKDSEEVTKVLYQFEKLCNTTKAFTYETQCDELLLHLNETKNHLSWTFSRLIGEENKRKRRGLLGKMLTAVFGVNDEVYQDINALNENQEKIIKSQKHQSRILVETLQQVNETESRIQKRLQLFQQKLNQGFAAIENMDRWYKATDYNKLNIHILQNYELAKSIFSEIKEYYSSLINIKEDRGTIYDIVPARMIQKAIGEANKKMANHIKILLNPMLKTEFKTNNTHFIIYQYFHIVDTTNFTLMKVTPVPIEINNGSYLIIQEEEEVLGINYDEQLYIKLTQEEMGRCTYMQNENYICAPTYITNLESSPNCIIDEIYGKPTKTKCTVRKFELKSTIWKKLEAENTWLIIPSTPTPVACICSGERKDEEITRPVILQMSNNCIIKSNSKTIIPNRSTSKVITNSYFKSINTSLADLHKSVTGKTMKTGEEEHIVGIRNPQLVDLIRQAEHEDEELDETVWKKTIKHYAVISSTSIASGLVIVIVIWVTIRKLKRRNQQLSSSSVPEPLPTTPRQKMITLQPLDPEGWSQRNRSLETMQMVVLQPLGTTVPFETPQNV